MRAAGWVLLIGALYAAVVALAHLGGQVQLGGGQGVVLPSWLVLVLFLPAVAVGRWLVLRR